LIKQPNWVFVEKESVGFWLLLVHRCALPEPADLSALKDMKPNFLAAFFCLIQIRPLTSTVKFHCLKGLGTHIWCF